MAEIVAILFSIVLIEPQNTTKIYFETFAFDFYKKEMF